MEYDKTIVVCGKEFTFAEQQYSGSTLVQVTYKSADGEILKKYVPALHTQTFFSMKNNSGTASEKSIFSINNVFDIIIKNIKEGRSIRTYVQRCGHYVESYVKYRSQELKKQGFVGEFKLIRDKNQKLSSESEKIVLDSAKADQLVIFPMLIKEYFKKNSDVGISPQYVLNAISNEIVEILKEMENDKNVVKTVDNILTFAQNLEDAKNLVRKELENNEEIINEGNER